MNKKQDLENSIENIYSVFDHYKANPRMNYCTHCADAEYVKKITSKELRLLTGKELSFYAFDAIHLMGDLKDFKYFLPRLLDLIVFHNLEFPIDPEIIFARLTYNSSSNWSNSETAALQQFMRIFWESQFIQYTDFNEKTFDIDSVLCSISQCENNIVEYLDYLLTLNENISKPYIFDFLYININSMVSDSKLMSPFWENNHQNMISVFNWFSNYVRKFHIESIFYFLPESESFRIESVTENLAKLKEKEYIL